MWTAPHRKKAQVTQGFNSGMVHICQIEDRAEPGHQPQPPPIEKGKLPYEEQRLGIQRYYSGKQNQVEIRRVIRTPVPPYPITNQDQAITEDGQVYGIAMIQTVPNRYPPAMDMTLSSIKQKCGRNV